MAPSTQFHPMPQLVSAEEWQKARDALLAKEKRLTRELDALAAERRRLPCVKWSQNYEFVAEDGRKLGLLDLFGGKRQLIVYHFMLKPGDAHPCYGCSSFVDNIGHLEHLASRDANFVLTSPATIEEIKSVKEKMGWSVPWYSSSGKGWEDDCGAGQEFGISVFVRDDDGSVYRTYYTTKRGSDRIRPDFNLMDLLPYGRQETWEDSPEGWPKEPPYQWWRLHYDYGNK